MRILFDQNIPVAAADWLRGARPDWHIDHVLAVGLEGRRDHEILAWATQKSAVIVTYDEDFADVRMTAGTPHGGVVRLRVWPTTIEMTVSALERVLDLVSEADLASALVIVDPAKIRVRPIRRNTGIRPGWLAGSVADLGDIETPTTDGQWEAEA